MSMTEKFKTFLPVRTFIFLVGTGDKNECIDLNGVCEVLNNFLKHLQEDEMDNERTELIIMQYAEEGLRKVLYLDLTDDDNILDLQFEIHGHPTSPFKALGETLEWIEERKKYFRSQGHSYYPFHVVLFPNLYDETDDYEDFNRVLLKLMEMRKTVIISAFQICTSENSIMLRLLKKGNKTLFNVLNLYDFCNGKMRDVYYADDYYPFNHSLSEAYEKLDLLVGLSSLYLPDSLRNVPDFLKNEDWWIIE